MPFALGMPIRTALPLSFVMVVLFLLWGRQDPIDQDDWLRSGLETMAVGAYTEQGIASRTQ
ncbi:MAG TPA: hypothetical protein VGK34_08870 [Armatimonadota bacterium]